MRTHNFTACHGNPKDSPKLAQQLALASTLDLDAIDVDVLRGPTATNAYRKGIWIATMAGHVYHFHGSVPHTAPLATQREHLTLQAAWHIAGDLMRGGWAP